MSTIVQETIKYKGWELLYWTGWKERYSRSTVTKVEAFGPTATGYGEIPYGKTCSVCQQVIKVGDEMIRTQDMTDRHWLCAHPDNPPNCYMAQWVFCRPESQSLGTSARYCYVNVPSVGAGEFDRGANFDVEAAFNIVTDSTTDEEKERLKAEGLVRMYALIDELEAAA